MKGIITGILIYFAVVLGLTLAFMFAEAHGAQPAPQEQITQGVLVVVNDHIKAIIFVTDRGKTTAFTAAKCKQIPACGAEAEWLEKHDALFQLKIVDGIQV